MRCGKLGRPATVSARALIERLPTEALLAHEGIRPQRRWAARLSPPFNTASNGLGRGDIVPGRVGQVGAGELEPSLKLPYLRDQAESAAHTIRLRASGIRRLHSPAYHGGSPARPFPSIIPPGLQGRGHEIISLPPGNMTARCLPRPATRTLSPGVAIRVRC